MRRVSHWRREPRRKAEPEVEADDRAGAGAGIVERDDVISPWISLVVRDGEAATRAERHLEKIPCMKIKQAHVFFFI